MKRFVFFCYCCIILPSHAQEYWQQEVNYKIDVRLDDKEHKLRATESFEYINHSPNVLNEIYIHLWPNAYKNKHSALAKQQYQQGEDKLYVGTEAEKGWIDSLAFKVNGKPVEMLWHPDNIDVCILKLAEPLVPEGKVTVSTPFTVKIPSGEISRLGHVGQSYQITQWYPKPAVYDKNGWNEMPYLNQGEFYSEYGTFDVSITLPKNYVVGATGDLQTESEVKFLDDLAAQTQQSLTDDVKKGRGKDPFPESSEEFKTIRFVQKNVHDFGWFADKRYKVLKGKVKLPHSGREVTTWAMFTPSNAGVWKNAIEYINDGTYHYSLWNGDYPYSQVTAVDGTISAGGGMEYPNVTVIGNARTAMELEIVIVHEVGHNWFYGILGTNERVHGWMDEGLNTLNEMRYVATKYPDNQQLSDMVLGGRFHLNDLDHHDMGDISYRVIAALGEDQAIETHSADFTSANYGVIMYQKTGLVFFYLKDYLGEEMFDKCMQEYFEQWKFKHPSPEDLQKVVEKVSGKKLDWLFGDLINTKAHLDFKIAKVRQRNGLTEVTVVNKGQVNGPVEVVAMKGGKQIESKWIEPLTDPGFLCLQPQKLVFESDELDRIELDPEKDIPEMYRQNNTWHRKGLLGKVEPLSMEFLFGDNEQGKTNIFWTPILGGNVYDKFMLGAAFHNMGIPFKKWQYVVAPMYSFGREMVSGMAEITYTSLPVKNVNLIRYGLSVRSFKEDSASFLPKQYGSYLAISPYVFMKLGAKKPSIFSHQLLAQGVLKYRLNGNLMGDYNGVFLQYRSNWSFADHNISLSVRPEFISNDQYQVVRTTASVMYRFRYLRQSMERWMELRVFAGKMQLKELIFPSGNTYRYTMSFSGTDGAQDLFFEDYYFGRGTVDGIWSQQRAENMGGFKSTSYYGTTTNWMTTANLLWQLPIPKLPIIYAFCDAGIFHNNVTVNTAINTGLAIRLSSIFGVYFPLWMSQELDGSFGNSAYAEKIRFTLRLNPVNSGLKLSGLF